MSLVLYENYINPTNFQILHAPFPRILASIRYFLFFNLARSVTLIAPPSAGASAPVNDRQAEGLNFSVRKDERTIHIVVDVWGTSKCVNRFSEPKNYNGWSKQKKPKDKILEPLY